MQVICTRDSTKVLKASLCLEVGMHQELLARINSSQLLLPENDHVNYETHQNIAELNFFYGIGEFSCFEPC